MPASSEAVKDFFGKYLQFEGYKGDEHWKPAYGKAFIDSFWNNEDCESAYVWWGPSTSDAPAGSDDEGGNELHWRFMSKKAIAEGKPTDALPHNWLPELEARKVDAANSLLVPHLRQHEII